MKLSQLAINDFIAIYKEYFSIELSYDEANELGLEFLNFFKLVYKPIPKKDSYLFEKAEPVYEIL